MSMAATFESAYDFEKLIGIEYERMGFNVQLNHKKNEPGYDFMAIKGNSLIAVQVKNYKRKVPVNVVLKFRDYMENSHMNYGAIISSNGFSQNQILDTHKFESHSQA